MAVFNSESIKKYLQETFSEELDLAFENAKDKGYQQALEEDPHLAAGLNVHAGRITHEVVRHALNQQ